MKKPVMIVGAIAVLFVAYFFVSPFIAFYSLRNGIKNSDVKKISRYVDFPALRQNLKEQLNAFQAGKSASPDHPLASIVTSLSPAVTDTLIDSFVTPKELGRFLKGKSHMKKVFSNDKDKTEKQEKENSTNSGKSKKKDIFSNAQFTFSSMRRFVVKIPSRDPDKIEFEFVFIRTGLNWKLTEAILPLDKFI